MWLRTGQLANRVQDIALAYRCAVIMPEGGGIWELYHGCYLGYKPNQDINFTFTPTNFIYTYKFFTRGIHEIYIPAIEKPDWSECTSHSTSTCMPYCQTFVSLCVLHYFLTWQLHVL